MNGSIKGDNEFGPEESEASILKHRFASDSSAPNSYLYLFAWVTCD